MLYPDHSNHRTWENSIFMIEDKASVLPYYIGNKINDTVIARLFENIMAGNNNDEEWEELLGVNIIRRTRTYYIFQVKLLQQVQKVKCEIIFIFNLLSGSPRLGSN